LFEKYPKQTTKQKMSEEESNMISDFILLECQTKSGSNDKRPCCYFNFQELYSFYLDHVEFINLTQDEPFEQRSIKTFMKLVHDLKVKKLNVFEMSFLCPICLKGSIAAREVKRLKILKIKNFEEFTSEKAKDLKMFESWISNKITHLDLVDTQRNVLRSQMKQLEYCQMIIVIDFTKYYSNLIDCIVFVYSKNEDDVKINEQVFHFLGNKSESLIPDHKYVRHVFNELYKKKYLKV